MVALQCVKKFSYNCREGKSGGARADISTELRSINFWRGVSVECLASFLYVLLVSLITVIIIMTKSSLSSFSVLSCVVNFSIQKIEVLLD